MKSYTIFTAQGRFVRVYAEKLEKEQGDSVFYIADKEVARFPDTDPVSLDSIDFKSSNVHDSSGIDRTSATEHTTPAT